MKKIIFSLFMAFGYTVGIMAQTDDNVLRINFRGTGNPIETDHLLEGVHITFSENGEDMTLKVNNAPVTYSLDNVSGMTCLNGTPSVTLTMNKDPDHTNTYYSTFYSSLEAYSIPAGVTAFTASKAESGWVSLSPITDVIPQKEPVLLQATSSSIVLPLVTSTASPSANNAFKGVDVETTPATDMKHYILSYGVFENEEKGVGFFRLPSGWTLSANKAYIALPEAAPQMLTRGLILSFPGSGTTGIESLDDTDSSSDVQIYNLSGQRIDQPEKALYIVNGKKVYIK